ncbi:substrate-binding domain-containing protein [Lactovum odontotermitis]
MNFKKGLMLAVLLTASAAGLAACSSGGDTSSSKNSSSKENNIVFVPKLTGNSYFESGNLGAQDMGKKAGFKVTYSGNSVASVANQVTIINNAVQQGAAGITLASVDPTGLDNALKQASKAGLKIVTWDSDVSPDARSIMVAQGTPKQLGEMIVSMSVDALKKRGLDPAKDKITYAWHYSSATVQDQNSWQKAGEDLIKAKYPNWVNVESSNYYSNQDAQTALNVGQSILSAHKDIDLIMCPDSTALPGQLQAAQNAGLTKDKVTITGFSTPNSIKAFAKANILEEWGLWDVKVQAGMAVFLTNYLAEGHDLKVGDSVDIPGVGKVTVKNNSELTAGAKDSSDSGVVLLPKRTVFTTANMDDYDF